MYDIQPFQTVEEVDPYLQSAPVYPLAAGYPTAVASHPAHLERHSISPSVFLHPLDEWFASQVETHTTIDATALPSSPSSAESSINHESPSSTHTCESSTTRPLKRKADDSDYEDDASSCCSEYIPHRPAKRSAPSKKAAPSPLPSHLQPIKVSSATLPRCPMPGCGVVLEDKDSAWRGHFKKVHHDELCLTSNCRGPHAGPCKARCPFPLPECKSCASGAMTIESVGRHLLNIHIKVTYRCPLCGLQNQWRESACVRHIKKCAERHGKAAKKRGDL